MQIQETMNAKIEGTMIGFESHGIMTAFIYVDYGGSHQGFRGYALTGGDAMNTFVKGVLEATGKEKWEDLKGTPVRIRRESGWNGKILAIGHFLEDKWFDPEIAFKKTS